MQIKHHLSGVAIAFPERKSTTKDQNSQALPSRPQGSLYSQQRRKIADATEYMRLYGKRKPLIFVLTTPGFLDHANEPNFLKKFIDNMRKNYGMTHYVWVREMTKLGYPHFHFIACCKRFDAVKMSRLWSSYFGESAQNSIRLGTKPKWTGKRWHRDFYVKSNRMARYLSKYIGKGIAYAERSGKRALRAFAVPEDLAELSEPIMYYEQIAETYQGFHYKVWYPQECPADWIELCQFDPRALSWKRVSEIHSVFFGYRKKQSKN